MGMNQLSIKEIEVFKGHANALVARLETLAVRIARPDAYTNSQAPMINFIRGSIKYFDELSNDFLGESTKEDNPPAEADHFANTFYRLANSMRSLSEFWKVRYTKSSQFALLEDVRTLIVHSGSSIDQITLPNTEKYKDNQLWRILKNTPSRHSIFFYGDMVAADYCVIVTSDKHDRQVGNHLAEVDYKESKDDCLDQWIYLWSTSIRNIVLVEVEHFLDEFEKIELPKGPSHFLNPKILEHVIDYDSSNINFDKIFGLINRDRRGGVKIENSKTHWFGFGMQKLLEYVNFTSTVTDGVQRVVFISLVRTIKNFWQQYPDENISDEQIVSFDIREIFKSYLPDFERKNYLEREKLFIYIAPFFNTPKKDIITDRDYLQTFVDAVYEASGVALEYSGDVDKLVCEYFCQSISKSLIISD